MPQPEKGTIDLRIPESIDAAGRLLEKLWIMSPYLVWTVLFMIFFAVMYLINQVGNRRTEKDLDEAVNYSAKKRRSKKKRNGAKEE